LWRNLVRDYVQFEVLNVFIGSANNLFMYKLGLQKCILCYILFEVLYVFIDCKKPIECKI